MQNIQAISAVTFFATLGAVRKYPIVKRHALSLLPHKLKRAMIGPTLNGITRSPFIELDSSGAE